MNGRGRPPRPQGPPPGQPPYGRGGFNQGPPMQQDGQFGQQGYGRGGYNPGQQNYGGAYNQGPQGNYQGQPGYSQGQPPGQPGNIPGQPGNPQQGYDQGPQAYGGWFSGYRGNGGGPMAYDSSHGTQNWNGQPGGPGQPPNGGGSSPQDSSQSAGGSPADVPPDGTATTEEEKDKPSPEPSEASVEAAPSEPEVVERKPCRCDCRGCAGCFERGSILRTRSCLAITIVMALLLIFSFVGILFRVLAPSGGSDRERERYDPDRIFSRHGRRRPHNLGDHYHGPRGEFIPLDRREYNEDNEEENR